MKNNIHYKVLGGQCAQQTLKGVVESFSSFNQLLRLFFKGESNQPRMPHYRKRGGLAPISFPVQPLKFNPETGECKLTISRENAEAVKEQFGITQLWINGCYGIKPEQIAEVRILPQNSCLYAEFVYKTKAYQSDIDPGRVLGIDPGLNNWLTCVSNIGKSFIVDGRKVKSLNHFYNKRVSRLKKDKPQGFWSDQLASITEKRNRQIRDAVNKAARFVLNWCLNYRIGTVVFGWNQGNKDGINIGKRNNQNNAYYSALLKYCKHLRETAKCEIPCAVSNPGYFFYLAYSTSRHPFDILPPLTLRLKFPPSESAASLS